MTNHVTTHLNEELDTLRLALIRHFGGYHAIPEAVRGPLVGATLTGLQLEAENTGEIRTDHGIPILESE